MNFDLAMSFSEQGRRLHNCQHAYDLDTEYEQLDSLQKKIFFKTYNAPLKPQPHEGELTG